MFSLGKKSILSLLYLASFHVNALVYQQLDSAGAAISQQIERTFNHTTATSVSHSLTVETFGNGTGSILSAPSAIDCGTECGTTFAQDSSVVLTATPTDGSHFAGWAGDLGDCVEANATCTTLMTEAPSVSATIINSDADGDGIDDEWESANGLDPNDPLDGDYDFDGDGKSNKEEFDASTDPLDPALLVADIEYVYDLSDRLVRVNYPNSVFIAYDYDAAGNITEITTFEHAHLALERFSTRSQSVPAFEKAGYELSIWNTGNIDTPESSFYVEYPAEAEHQFGVFVSGLSCGDPEITGGVKRFACTHGVLTPNQKIPGYFELRYPTQGVKTVAIKLATENDQSIIQTTVNEGLTPTAPVFSSGGINPSNLTSGEEVTFNAIWVDVDDPYIVNAKVRYRKKGTISWTEHLLLVLNDPVENQWSFQKSNIVLSESGDFEYQFSADSTRLPSSPTSASASWSELSEFTVVNVDIDSDNDGISDSLDNCPNHHNVDQLNTDNDSQGDACDDDDDNDGMSDVFENENGLNSLDGSDAGLDLDGDGFTNLEEYEAGSDPTDDQSTPETVKPFQIVGLEACAEIELNSIANCAVHYNTSDESNASAGFGFRLHFNASQLNWSGTSNSFSDGLVDIDSSPVADDQDFDNDPTTTHYIGASWSGAEWPGVGLPVTLFHIQLGFIEAAVNDDDTSTIGFSSTELDENYQFSGQAATLTARNSCNLDIDGDGNAGPLSDGLLILRYMFNFTGNTLVDGMFSASSQRNTANDVEAYLAGCAAMLDVDDNGEVKPLSDGLLILRHLFNLRGEALVNGVLPASARRTTATEISDYLEAIYP